MGAMQNYKNGVNKLANHPTNFFHGERFFQNSGVSYVQCSISFRNISFSSPVISLLKMKAFVS